MMCAELFLVNCVAPEERHQPKLVIECLVTQDREHFVARNWIRRIPEAGEDFNQWFCTLRRHRPLLVIFSESVQLKPGRLCYYISGVVLLSTYNVVM